jgi:hypothetical protein
MILMAASWRLSFFEKQVVILTKRLFLALNEVFTPSMCRVGCLPTWWFSPENTLPKAAQSSVQNSSLVSFEHFVQPFHGFGAPVADGVGQNLARFEGIRIDQPTFFLFLLAHIAPEFVHLHRSVTRQSGGTRAHLPRIRQCTREYAI